MGTPAQLVEKFLAQTVLRDPPDTPMVALGPVVWGREPGSTARHWWFTLGSADAKGEFHLDCMKIAHDDKAMIETARAGMMLALVPRHAVINDFDDELRMMRFCEQVWPCDRTRELRELVERERAGKGS
jgi:hypothetical protein